MKAYKVYTTYEDNPYCTIAFAETPSQAKTNALLDEGLADEDYTDLRARRIPELDHIADNTHKIIDWYNDTHLIAAVKQGITCSPYDTDTHYCETMCAAVQYCETYKMLSRENTML